MAKLNQIECVTGYKNVGFGTCVFDPKLIAGAMLFPGRKVFTANEIASLRTTLANMAKSDNKSERMFPIHKFVDVEDNTEDTVIETTGYGAKFPVRDGDYDFKFKFFDGALCLLTALQTFNGPTPFLLYDKKNNIIGTTVDGKLSTIDPHFFRALPWRLATGSNSATYKIQLSFLPEYINENLAFVPAGFDLKEIVGLKDVEVIINSYDEGTGVANVTLQTLCNKTNVYDLFSTEFSDEANWVALNNEDGEEITVASVATAPQKTFDVTIDTEDENYPAAGGTILLNIAASSVLSEADIVGYEGVEVKIELAAS